MGVVLIVWATALMAVAVMAAFRRWRSRRPPLRALLGLVWPAGVIVVALAASVRLQATDLLLRTSIDISQHRHNTLTSASISLLRNVDRTQQTVHITGFFPADQTEWRPVTVALERYADRSQMVKVRFVDPDQEPSTARAYAIGKIGEVVVESGQRQVRVESPSELAVSSAIAQVVNENPMVCWSAGHGEIEPDDPTLEALTKGLAQVGVQIHRVRLSASADIPQDCKIVAVVAPRTPPLDMEAQMLRRRMQAQDLRILLLADPDVAGPEVNGAWGDVLGVKIKPDRVSDPQGAVYGDPRTLLVDRFPSLNPVTTGLPAALLVGVAALDPPADQQGGLTVSVLASASSAEDARGPAPILAVALDRSSVDGDGEQTAIRRFRAVVIGDADWLRNSSWSVSANSTLAAQTFRWLAEPEPLVSVPVPVPGGGLIAVSSKDIRRIDTGMFAVPGLLVGLVWSARWLTVTRRGSRRS
ncbi:MAG: Gldg family protein [Actinomycetota bacterium]